VSKTKSKAEIPVRAFVFSVLRCTHALPAHRRNVEAESVETADWRRCHVVDDGHFRCTQLQYFDRIPLVTGARAATAPASSAAKETAKKATVVGRDASFTAFSLRNIALPAPLAQEESPPGTPPEIAVQTGDDKKGGIDKDIMISAHGQVRGSSRFSSAFVMSVVRRCTKLCKWLAPDLSALSSKRRCDR
jgi:hypothetical protein